MNPENIERFRATLAANPALQAKVQAIHEEVTRETARRIAALSVEVGTPFTAEQFLAGAAPNREGLSDEQLESVAGGRNIMLSIYTAERSCY